ncbi:xanthine dehydrogenase family protein molybdopterin-binding subunit [Neomoorella mulderi]|uniref:Nicotinate dehydrogenase large molybdopterin subunit n=1 Tax=Moorella mulderi DSM 14980 TaxID=1122241 RepID=A0A151AZX2_9FIRM|nr:molybdopterin cofactor-binding domain-containing protein [Moorella mulderi]KYH33186.1 nicotinate dehydrogenase large molybdopterin subunit [Moorella mulderi DSM 14980]
MPIIGTSPPRVDARSKVTGQAIYPADVNFPGMIYGQAVRSPYAHARIINIDTSAALEVPGVLCVLTARDIPGHNGQGVVYQDMPVLARDEARSVNDVVALVGATTPAAARAGAAKVKVTYEELPALLDPIAAMQPWAPRVHPDRDNVIYHLPIRKGNVEAGFAAADVIVENTYRTQLLDHAFLQPEAAVARVDERGHLVIYVATQYVHWDRTEVARVLGWNQDRIRIVAPAVGGAFGGREDMTLQTLVALLAVHTSRPAKMVLTREESFLAHSKRHPMIMRYKTGATRDGKLTALEAEIIGDSGAYSSWAPNVLRKAAIHATGPYVIPNVKIDAYAVYTNNPFTGAMRGFGATQPPLAYESQMDELASRLGIHPFTIRWLNAFRQGDITATGQVLESSVGLIDTMLQAARAAGWSLEELIPGGKQDE